LAITWPEVFAAQIFLHILIELVELYRMVYHLYDFASGPSDHILPKFLYFIFR